MGHSKVEKAESHERIVKVAAGIFRELGVDGISLADLMKCAGLTQGGFYRHFGSRDDLVTEAVARALKDGSAVADAIAVNPRSTIGTVVDAYLSVAHRDNVASGCALTALANDVARSTDRARSAYSLQVGRYVDLISSSSRLQKKATSVALPLIWVPFPWREQLTTMYCRGKSESAAAGLGTVGNSRLHRRAGIYIWLRHSCRAGIQR
jgi:TetR/AcrR family transcriptional repressor of nem operon